MDPEPSTPQNKNFGCGLHLDKRNIFHIINKDFKGAVVNRALSSLHGVSSEITLTVPLMLIQAQVT